MTPTKIYRGIRLNDLPPELWAHIRRYMQIPYEESEVGQHFRVGPALLDHIENSHWEQGREDFEGYDTANLGRNWTLDRSWAEKAGSPNTGRCDLGVLLEADMPTNPYAFDPTNNTEDMRNVESEKQVTPIPGAPLNITGVKIRDGGEWREVLNDPEYVARRSKEYPSILQHHTGPQIRLAMTSADDYALERWREGSQYFFSYTPKTYVYRGPKVRPVTPRPPGYDSGSDFNFTGSPETQYHHRSITPETLKGIDKREDSVDDYYAEMAQRRESGLEPIPWNEWLNRVAHIRHGMPITHIPPMNHFDEKLFLRQLHNLVYSDDEIAGRPDRTNIIRTQYGNAGKGPVDEYGALVSLIHHDENGAPNGILHYFPHGSYRAGEQPGGIQVMVHPAHQGKGVGTKLMQHALAEFGKDSSKAAERKRQHNYEPIDLENQQYTPGGYELYKRVRRTAMAWDEWAPKIQGACEECNYSPSNGSWPPPMTYGRYVIPEAGAFLDFEHRSHKGEPELFVSGIYTHPQNRNDGVAEALMRKLVEEHPGVRINPGIMTNDGQKFHDQMLEKEPEARELLANSLLVGPEDAYDEWDWFRRHQEHPPSSVNTDAETWYHVSPHHIPVGTTLAPMRGDTPWNDDPYDHGLQNRAGWIWVEFDKDKSRAWMRHILKHQPEAWIYRVKPDVGPFAWNGTADEGWVTNRAIVLEELDQISRDLTFQEQP